MKKVTSARGFDAQRHAVSQERPRLFGSRQQLKELTQKRAEPYQRVLQAARHPVNAGSYDEFARLFGASMVYVLEGNNAAEARKAVDLVLQQYVDKPLQIGHITFAYSLARSAIVYDHCHDLWTNDEKKRFQQYVHATIDANVESETSVFHNGWWGYKHWGYALAGYALMHDDPEAPRILADLESDYLKLGVPGLKMAGEGGGWAEGYYINYWLHEWLFMCEVARTCEGLDYYAPAPEFFGQAAIALMFSHYPPIYPPGIAPAPDPALRIVSDNTSRRPIPMGDGHGQYVKHERDKMLMARRVLARYYRDDPAHQVVHAFNQQTPRVAVPCDAFMDFLWDDRDIPVGNLDAFKLSHVSAGPGFAFARSSWNQDATHFFFRSGRRFTSHQHMDNGHFLIFKNNELLGDGGHYDTFGGPGGNHAINYYMRTIAHNSILIHDPNETWPQPTETTKGMRAGPTSYNEGGQAFPWIAAGLGHNGGVPNVEAFHKFQKLFDVAALTAFKDFGPFVYTAGDFTKSYSAQKAKCVTRQIVYLRPGTFVIFDRVESTNAAFRKTFVLQPMKIPQQQGKHWVVTHGRGRLFIQTLAPADAAVQLYHGDKLYEYGGKNFPPSKLPDAAPECRMEISPPAPATMDYFLHVLTVGDDQSAAPVPATLQREAKQFVVRVGEATLRFELGRCAGSITLGKQTHKLAAGGAKPSFV